MTKSRAETHARVKPGHGPDSLPGGDTPPRPAEATVVSLDANERELLAMYRALPPTLRPKLLAVVREL